LVRTKRRKRGEEEGKEKRKQLKIERRMTEEVYEE
jgi:hypothetical protein